jgi:hypothetical protein
MLIYCIFKSNSCNFNSIASKLVVVVVVVVIIIVVVVVVVVWTSHCTFRNYLLKYHSSLRHSPTSLEVAGSSPGKVISPIVAVGLTHSLPEMSTRALPHGRRSKTRSARKDDNLTAICEPTV